MVVFDVGGFASWWFRKRNYVSMLVRNYLKVGGNFATFLAFLYQNGVLLSRVFEYHNAKMPPARFSVYFQSGLD